MAGLAGVALAAGGFAVGRVSSDTGAGHDAGVREGHAAGLQDGRCGRPLQAGAARSPIGSTRAVWRGSAGAQATAAARTATAARKSSRRSATPASPEISSSVREASSPKASTHARSGPSMRASASGAARSS